MAGQQPPKPKPVIQQPSALPPPPPSPYANLRPRYRTPYGMGNYIREYLFALQPENVPGVSDEIDTAIWYADYKRQTGRTREERLPINISDMARASQAYLRVGSPAAARNIYDDLYGRLMSDVPYNYDAPATPTSGPYNPNWGVSTEAGGAGLPPGSGRQATLPYKFNPMWPVWTPDTPATLAGPWSTYSPPYSTAPPPKKETVTVPYYYQVEGEPGVQPGQFTLPTGAVDPYQVEQMEARANLIELLQNWDWQNPPVDPVTGRPFNKYGQVLPYGALRWDANSRPWYGDGMAGLLRKWTSKSTAHLFTRYDPNIDDLVVEVSPYAGLELSEKISPMAGMPGFREALKVVKHFTPEEDRRYFVSEKGAVYTRPIPGEAEKEIDIWAQEPSPEIQAIPSVWEGLKATGKTVWNFGIEVLPDFWAVTSERILSVYNAQQIRNIENGFMVLPTGDGTWDYVQLPKEFREVTRAPRTPHLDRSEIDKAWAAGDLLYTTFVYPAQGKELERMWAAGIPAGLITAELEDPIVELIGRATIDPVNLLPFPGLKAKRVAQIASAADLYIKPVDEIAEGLAKVGMNVTDPGRAAAWAAENFPKDILVVQQQLAMKGIGKYLFDRGRFFGITNPVRFLTALTTDGVRATIKGWIRNIDNMVIKNLVDGDLEDAIDLHKAMYQIGNTGSRPEDLAEVAEGFGKIMGAKTSRPFLSLAGQTYSYLLRRVIGDSVQDWYDEAIEMIATDPMDYIQAMSARLDKAVDELIPDLPARIRAEKFMRTVTARGVKVGDELPTGGKLTQEALDRAQAILSMGRVTDADIALAKLHTTAQKYLWAPARELMVTLFMGWRLPFAIRNAMNNTVTVAIDEGPEAVFGPMDDVRDFLQGLIDLPTAAIKGKSVKQAVKAIDWLETVLGGVPEATMAAYGHGAGPALGVSVKQMEEARQLTDWLRRPVLRMAANFENHASLMVTYRAAKDAMRSMAVEGRAIPPMKFLIDNGLPPELGPRVTEDLIANNYNLKATLKNIRHWIRTGQVEAWRDLHIFTGPLRQQISKFDMENKIREALKAPTLDEALRKIEQIRLERQRYITTRLPDEPLGVSATDELYKTLMEIGEDIVGRPGSRIADSFFGWRAGNRAAGSAYGSAIGNLRALWLKAANGIASGNVDPNVLADLPGLRNVLDRSPMEAQRMLQEYALKAEDILAEQARYSATYNDVLVSFDKVFSRLDQLKQAKQKLTPDEARKIWAALIGDLEIKAAKIDYSDPLQAALGRLATALRQTVPDSASSLRKHVWNDIWHPLVRTIYGEAVDHRSYLSEGFVTTMPDVLKPKNLDAAMHNARDAYTAMAEWDAWEVWQDIVGGNPERIATISPSRSRIFVWARDYGIASISEAGKPMDGVLLKIINAHLPEGMEKFTDLGTASLFPKEVKAAFATHRSLNIPEIAAARRAKQIAIGVGVTQQAFEEMARETMAKVGLTEDQIGTTLAWVEQRAKGWASLDPRRRPEEWYGMLRGMPEYLRPRGAGAWKEGEIPGGALAVTFYDGMRAYIDYLPDMMKMGDFTSVPHEYLHVFRDELPDEDIWVLEDWLKSMGFPIHGHKDWSTFADERYAHMGSEIVMAQAGFMRERNIPPEILNIFEKFKVWIKEGVPRTFQMTMDEYEEVLRTTQIPPDVRAVFENLFVPRAPYIEGTPISLPRAVAETQPAFEEMLRQVGEAIRNNWGKMSDIVGNPMLDKALTRWATMAEGTLIDAKIVAARVGEAARNFALHDYRMKRGFDTVLAYIFPFEYWYSRTYVNWMQRIAQRPDVMAAYAMYKDAMAKVHADAPEWWRYNINTNELLGLDSDEPWFFNLEQSLNPMYGLTGVDFNDPEKRYNGIATLVDQIDNYGPSVHPLINWALAIGAFNKGETEAGQRWLGRLIPQTKDVRNLLSLLGVQPTKGLLGGDWGKYGEFDPFVSLGMGGLEWYDRRKVYRMIGQMQDEATANGDTELALQLERANYDQSGPLWDMAANQAIRYSAGGGLEGITRFLPWLGSQLGVGFKPRTKMDMMIDMADQEIRLIMKMRPNMSLEEYRAAMDAHDLKYPWHNVVRMGRRDPEMRDESITWNVLNRIPPGMSDVFFPYEDEQGRLPVETQLKDKFYQVKGDLTQFTPEEREQWVNFVLALQAALTIPDDATQAEWDDAKARYREMSQVFEERYGEDIFERMSYAQGVRAAGGVDAIYQYVRHLEQNPDVAQAIYAKDAWIMGDPVLSDYYLSFAQIENHYRNVMEIALVETFGRDMLDLWMQARQNPMDEKAFKSENRDFVNKYYDIRRQYEKIVAERIAQAADLISKRPDIELRPEREEVPALEQRLRERAAEIEPPTVFDIPAGTWLDMLPDYFSPQSMQVLVDYMQYPDYDWPGDVQDVLYSTLNTMGEDLAQFGFRAEYNPYVVLEALQRAFEEEARMNEPMLYNIP